MLWKSILCSDFKVQLWTYSAWIDWLLFGKRIPRSDVIAIDKIHPIKYKKNHRQIKCFFGGGGWRSFMFRVAKSKDKEKSFMRAIDNIAAVTIQMNDDCPLTQKYSALKPGIRVCDAPTWCKYSKNVSKSSKLLMPSSNVSITLLACSANSSDDACSSLVFSSLNLLNSPNSSPCSSNSL